VYLSRCLHAVWEVRAGGTVVEGLRSLGGLYEGGVKSVVVKVDGLMGCDDFFAFFLLFLVGGGMTRDNILGRRVRSGLRSEW